VLLLLVVVACADGAVWFDDLSEPPKISDQDRLALAQYVRDKLAGAASDFPAALRDDDKPRIVFLSVSEGMSKARVFVSATSGLHDAFTDAIQQAGQIRARWIRLDVVDHVDVYTVQSTLLPGWQRGVHGLAFDRDIAVAVLADQLIAGSFLDQSSKLAIGRLASAEPRINALQKANKMQVYRFTTMGVFCDQNGPRLLTNGRESFDHAQAGDYEQAAELAGDYLRRSVDDDGRFIYLYKPDTDQAAKKYNILRHAGSIFAMLQVYELTREDQMLSAVERALIYLEKQVRGIELQGQRLDVIVEKNAFKIGGNALAVLALTQYVAVTGNHRKLALAQRLAALMPALQDDDGRFTIHKGTWPQGKATSFISGYYPGEAIFALMRLYSLDQDKRWLQCAQRNAHYLNTVRDVNVPIDKRLPDHWLLYGLNELHRVTPKASYLKHARLIAQSIRLPQHVTSSRANWVGGYDTPPRSTPTATRTEGLIAAYHLLRDFGGNADELVAIRRSVQMGAQFDLRCQMKPAHAMYFADPARCLGGLSERLDKPDLRIDYAQHAISAWLGMARILREKNK
jgi:hypothetical protein